MSLSLLFPFQIEVDRRKTCPGASSFGYWISCDFWLKDFCLILIFLQTATVFSFFTTFGVVCPKEEKKNLQAECWHRVRRLWLKPVCIAWWTESPCYAGSPLTQPDEGHQRDKQRWPPSCCGTCLSPQKGFLSLCFCLPRVTGCWSRVSRWLGKKLR